MENHIIPQLLDPESVHERAFCISMSRFLNGLFNVGWSSKKKTTLSTNLSATLSGLRGAFDVIPSLLLSLYPFYLFAALSDVYLFCCCHFFLNIKIWRLLVICL